MAKKIEKIQVINYGEETIFDNRDEAKKFFLECMQESEGAERDRYTNIYLMLMDGKNVCYDYEEEYNAFLEREKTFGTDISESPYITKEEYLKGKDGYIIIADKYRNGSLAFNIIDTITGDDISDASIYLDGFTENLPKDEIFISPNLFDCKIFYNDFKNFFIEKELGFTLYNEQSKYMVAKLKPNIKDLCIREYMLRDNYRYMSYDELCRAICEKVEDEFEEWKKEIADKLSGSSPEDILKNHANAYSHREDIVYIFRNNVTEKELSENALRNLLKNDYNALESVYQEWVTSSDVDYEYAINELGLEYEEEEDEEKEIMPQIHDMAADENLVPMPGSEKLIELKNEYSK